MIKCNDVKQDFLKNTADHSMEVIHDDGVHRHLRFSRNGSSVYYFNLTTWPGHLAISGDMGCFVFSRVHDMFRFFRQDELVINLGYWSEKCVAVEKHGGIETFSPEFFRDAVKSEYDNWMECCSDPDRYKGLWDELEEYVLQHADDGEHDAMECAMTFCYNQFEMNDFYEHRLHDYTYHFVWCLYAIVWGIQEYDQR